MQYKASETSADSQYYKLLCQQLMAGIKYHHSETIIQLPRDLALQAINEAWKSSQDEFPN
jgi:hypothetical protein